MDHLRNRERGLFDGKALIGKEEPQWYRHPLMGWVFLTTQEIARLERETPTRKELAEKVVPALVPSTVGVERKSAEIIEDENGFKVRAGIRFKKEE